MKSFTVALENKKKERKASKMANLPLAFIPKPKEWPPKVKVGGLWEKGTQVFDEPLAHVLTSNTLYMLANVYIPVERECRRS